MANNCKKIQNVVREVCIAALDRRIEIDTRAITTPVLGGVDYGEEFTPTYTVWANIVTKDNLIEFDKSNTDRRVTHIFTMRFKSDVTAESWVRFDNKLFDILKTEDLEERHEYLRLVCTERGLDTQFSNFS